MSEATQDTNRQRVLLMVLGAVVALALLFFFVVNPLLFGSDDAGSAPLPPAVGAQADPSEVPATAGSEAPEPAKGDKGKKGKAGQDKAGQGKKVAVPKAPLTETFEVFSARDPFQQLVTEGDESASSTQPADETDPSEAPVDAAPDDTSVDGITIELVDVFVGENGAETVLVAINGTGYEVQEGQVFAENYEVLDIDGSCATFRYGDEQFTLCEGEEIRK